MTLLWTPLWMMGGCESDCLGPDCEPPSSVPWDPGTLGEEGGEYGSGGGGGGGDDDETETETQPQILTRRSCEVVLRHQPAKSPSTVEVTGEFNSWIPTALEGPNAEGDYTVDLGILDPGEYAFRYVYDGVPEATLPINVYTRWDGATEHRSLRVGDCQRPLLQTVEASADGSGDLQATFQFASAEDGSAIDPDTLVVTAGNEPVAATVDEDGLITVELSGLPRGKHSLRVWASDRKGRRSENEPLFVPLWVEDQPFAWQDGLLYFVFTDRFRNGDYGNDAFTPMDDVDPPANYLGGDFQGVIHAIEEGYFESLGVKTLWLSPVYENPDEPWTGNTSTGVRNFSGYHGYWPIDPLGIEERFGDAGADASARLDQLIETAHAHGLRVLFDLVLNHVHEEHPYVADHPDWFESGCVCGTPGCDWNEKPVECWFTEYLPDLNYKIDDVKQQVIADTLRLVELHDVDAVRVDAAKHMDHVIMRTLSKRLKDDYEAGGGAPFLLIGETFDGNPELIMQYVNDWELAGQFDFPLYFALRDTFARGQTFHRVEGQYDQDAALYGDALMSPFLGNHDDVRFASVITGVIGDFWNGEELDPMAEGGAVVTEQALINQISMSFAYTLTQPGIPLLYYGDEIGLAGGGDPDNRRGMHFDPYLSANQSALLERVRQIGRIRTESEAIRRGERVRLLLEDEQLVYALDNGGGDVAIVALNKAVTAATLDVDVSTLGIGGATLVDEIGGREVEVDGGTLSIRVPAGGYQIWVRP